jgi:hypothetical protein
MLNAPIVVRALPGHMSGSGKHPRPLSRDDVSQTQEWLQHFGLTKLGKEPAIKPSTNVHPNARFIPSENTLSP